MRLKHCPIQGRHSVNARYCECKLFLILLKHSFPVGLQLTGWLIKRWLFKSVISLGHLESLRCTLDLENYLELKTCAL